MNRPQPENIFTLTQRLVKLRLGVQALEEEDFTAVFADSRLVLYKDVANLPKMKRLAVGTNGTTIHLPKSGNGVLFLTELEPGGYIGPHYHTDCLEVVHVLEGPVLEVHSGVVYKPGQVHQVGYGEVHHYMAMGKPVQLLVEIYQPSIRATLRDLWQLWSKLWLVDVFGKFRRR